MKKVISKSAIMALVCCIVITIPSFVFAAMSSDSSGSAAIPSTIPVGAGINSSSTQSGGVSGSDLGLTPVSQPIGASGFSTTNTLDFASYSNDAFATYCLCCTIGTTIPTKNYTDTAAAQADNCNPINSPSASPCGWNTVAGVLLPPAILQICTVGTRVITVTTPLGSNTTSYPVLGNIFNNSSIIKVPKSN